MHITSSQLRASWVLRSRCKCSSRYAAISGKPRRISKEIKTIASWSSKVNLNSGCSPAVICQSYRFRRGGGGTGGWSNRVDSKRSVSVWLPLLRKSWLTISMLALIRFMYFIPTKGLDMSSVPPGLTTPEQRMLQELFMAGGSVPFNIAALGITPIVVASMFISVLSSFSYAENIPFFGSISRDLRQKQKSGTLSPEEVDRKTNLYSIIIGALLGYQQAKVLRSFAVVPNFVFSTVIDWLAALALTKYACTLIQDAGLGDGTGCLILALSLSGFAGRVTKISSFVTSGSVALWKVVLLSGLYVFMVAVCVWVTAVEIRLPTVSYSRGVSKRGGIGRLMVADDSPMSKSSKQSYLPLPIARGGVTAIFLCSAAFYSFDAWLLSLSLPAWAAFLQAWPFRLCSFGLGVFAASLIPLGVASADMVSEFLVATNSGIKGIVPGEPTRQHIKARMFEATLWGGFAMGIIATLSLWLDWQCQAWLGTPFGTLNLVLLVAVISAAVRQIESLLEGPKLRQIMTREHKIMGRLQVPQDKDK